MTSHSKAKSNVLIAKFMNGRLNHNQAHTLKFGCFEKQEPSRKRQVLVAESDSLNYVGQSHGPNVSNRHLYARHLLCVKDKKTQKMKILDAKIIDMRPVLHGEDELEENPEESIFKPNMSYLEKNDLVTTAFGGAKKKAAMEARIRNKIEGDVLDAAVGSVVNHTLAQTTLEDIESSLVKEDANSVIPPINKEAQLPSDVYSFSDIISDEVMIALGGAVGDFVDSTREIITQWKQEKKYPDYIIAHLFTLPMESKARLHRAQCLLYLHYMVLMHHLKYKDMRRKDPLPEDVPTPVSKHLLNSFTQTSIAPNGRKSRVCPARLKDKLISYILVLCLFIDEYEVEYTPLLQDLTLTSLRMQTYFRNLGCKVKVKKGAAGEGDARLAELAIPLTFPDPTKKKGPKRR